VDPRESRESAKERRRREAEARAQRERKLGPQRRKVAAMEAEIAALEAAQRERSTLLADPALYDDEARRSAVIGAYQEGVRALEELTGAWEIALGELEALEADDA
ncbi:MAG: ABC transporter ATP-binding protein, partial [Myxococcales bacterium]|nr:ABC transporter ATP-binding protein [Myxococcales bacterium]